MYLKIGIYSTALTLWKVYLIEKMSLSGLSPISIHPVGACFCAEHQNYGEMLINLLIN